MRKITYKPTKYQIIDINKNIAKDRLILLVLAITYQAIIISTNYCSEYEEGYGKNLLYDDC